MSATRVLLSALLVLTLAACTDPPTRGGQDADGVAIRVVYGNSAGSIGSDVLDALTENPTRTAVSLRNISEDVDPSATYSSDEEGETLDLLRAGTADLTIVRAGRLALAGAEPLAVLHAPLVVTNGDQARRIAADPLALAALDSLDGTGLVGLALVPGSSRRLFGYGEAVTTPGDLAGQRLSVRPDAAVAAMAAALGSTADERVNEERSAAVEAGMLRAIESSLDQRSAVDRPAVVTSNLTLYEKFDVVVVRESVFEALSAPQQAALRRSVAQAAEQAVQARPDEAASLSAWCGDIASASIRLSPEQLDRFRAVLDPVADALATTSESRARLARMRALHDGTVDSDGTTCSGASEVQAADFDLEPAGSQAVLDGVWRADATREALAAVGADAQTIANNRGIWMFRITNGLARVDQPSGPDCTMPFTFADDRVLLDQAAEGNDSCGGLALGTYRVAGDVARFVWTADRYGGLEIDQALLGTLTRASP